MRCWVRVCGARGPLGLSRSRSLSGGARSPRCARGAEAAVTCPRGRKRKRGRAGGGGGGGDAVAGLSGRCAAHEQAAGAGGAGRAGLGGEAERTDGAGPPRRAPAAGPDPPPSPPAVLPGVELRHDRVLSPHDLEGTHGGDGQRESHRGGAEVSPRVRGFNVAGEWPGPRGDPHRDGSARGSCTAPARGRRLRNPGSGIAREEGVGRKSISPRSVSRLGESW